MFDLKDLMSRVNLPQDITRRGFLQVATVTAAFAAMNQSRAQTGAQPYIILETPKGLIVGDPSLFVDFDTGRLRRLGGGSGLFF